MAANVSYKKPEKAFILCSIYSKLLGKDATHPIYKCDKFPSNKDKIKKLQEINVCTRCSYLNHTSNNWKYRFKNK